MSLALVNPPDDYRPSLLDKYGVWIGTPPRLVYSSRLKKDSRWKAIQYKRCGWSSATWRRLTREDFDR